jgi:hypothetical protein
MPFDSYSLAREITRPVNSTQVRVLAMQAQMNRLSPLPRLMSEDEVTLFAAAEEAGAVIAPRLLREHLSGKPCCPFQFEGCHLFAEDMDSAWIVEAVEKACERRDAFCRRVESGDLAEVVARIDARNAAQRKVA